MSHFWKVVICCFLSIHPIQKWACSCHEAASFLRWKRLTCHHFFNNVINLVQIWLNQIIVKWQHDKPIALVSVCLEVRCVVQVGYFLPKFLFYFFSWCAHPSNFFKSDGRITWINSKYFLQKTLFQFRTQIYWCLYVLCQIVFMMNCHFIIEWNETIVWIFAIFNVIKITWNFDLIIKLIHPFWNEIHVFFVTNKINKLGYTKVFELIIICWKGLL